MSESSLRSNREKAMESASSNRQNRGGTSTVAIQVQERNYEVVTMEQSAQQQDSEQVDQEMCERGRNNNNNSNNTSDNCEAQSRNTIINISEPKRRRLASLCCLLGVIGIAAGAGLILIYLIGEYTPLFGEISNLQAVSIPGFVFLFIGIFTSVVGIFFCWIYTSANASRMNIEDEMQSGFSLPGHPRSGAYDNHCMILDHPPSYTSVARSRSFIASLQQGTEDSTNKLPSYFDATILKEDQEDSKSIYEVVVEENDSPDPPPPPY